MNKQAIIRILKNSWFFILEYFKTYAFPRLKEAFMEHKDQFINNIWESLKDDIKQELKKAIAHIHKYLESPSYEEKEKFLINFVCQKIKLPFILKPLRPVLKNILKGKLKALINENLNKLDQKI